MKKYIKKFFNTPYIAISTILIVAIIIGIASYKEINKKTVYSFTKVQLGSISETDTANKNLTLAFVSGGKISSVLVKNGDSVKTGQVLATLDNTNSLGVITQAKAAYALAEANYQKVLNGATSTAIDVAKAAVKTAQINLDQTNKQQINLVNNAYSNLLSKGLEALPTINTTAITPPILSGSYTKNIEGGMTIKVYPNGDNGYFNVTGIIIAQGNISTTVPQALGDSGLFITFTTKNSQPDWIITIPNKNSSNYLTNYNTYQTALQTKDQAIALAQASLDQTNAALTNLEVAARPEDVASAKAQVESAFGALQIAQGNYNNTVITAPSEGVINSVAINPGQIITPNSPAITMLAQSITKNNILVLPKNTLIYKNNKTYILVESPTGPIQKEIVVGISNETMTEVVSGLNINDQVAILN